MTTTKREQHTDAAGATHTDVPELSYEQARAELAEVVAALESGGAPLAESVELWRRGEKLADICQQWLDGAKAALDQVADGASPA
jgi:exodeoxyribonuclease VII small subunit